MSSNKLEKISEDKIDFLQEMNDGSVQFTCERAEILFPDTFIDHKIAEIVGMDVIIFGLFEIKVYMTEEDYVNNKPKHIFFKHIGKILTCPSAITDTRDANKEKCILLSYKKGDSFIKNVNITVDSKVASILLDLMTLGYFPNVINYDDLATYWANASKYNGVSLDSMSMTSIELIVSEICRDPKNLARPFRHKLRENPKTDHKDWKMINIRLLPKYSSIWASITSGDPRNNLISIISRMRKGEGQKYSPVEDAAL